jgi:hypothetical protein
VLLTLRLTPTFQQNGMLESRSNDLMYIILTSFSKQDKI